MKKQLTIDMLHSCLYCDDISEADIEQEHIVAVPQANIKRLVKELGLDPETAKDLLQHRPDIDWTDRSLVEGLINHYVEHYEVDKKIGEHR